MKKIPVITFGLIAVVIFISCSDVKRKPGRDYMPDMKYSRAYDTYEPTDNLKALNIHYNASPVPGTVKRGELFPFPINKDADNDSTNYVASRQVANPMAQMDTFQMKEAERLYLINCGICHGTALDGNGPLYNGGNGPYPAAPKNLVADPKVSVMPEGQLFYSVTYGKGLMGPYGPQLSTTQRWMIVHYVKSRQIAAKGGDAPASAESTNGSGGPSIQQTRIPGAITSGASSGNTLSK